MKLFEDVLVEKIRKHWIELTILTISIIIFFASLLIYSQADKVEQTDLSEIQSEQIETKSPEAEGYIYIDVSGAVIKPDLYQVSPSARLKDAIVLSGGLSDKADREYFARQYNLASHLTDGQKIYIPTKKEVLQGVNEASFSQQEGQGQVAGVDTSGQDSAGQINVNSASADALDTLFGVGPATAQKIINGRPYSTIDELLTKKAVNTRVFEMIRDKITVN